MKAPFVVIATDDGSVDLCETLIAPIEPQDVSNCLAFDSEGRVLSLVAETVTHERKFLWLKWSATYKGVSIKESDPDRKDVAGLQKLLTQYLVQYHRKTDKELQNFPLAKLLEEVRTVQHYRKFKALT